MLLSASVSTSRSRLGCLGLAQMRLGDKGMVDKSRLFAPHVEYQEALLSQTVLRLLGADLLQLLLYTFDSLPCIVDDITIDARTFFDASSNILLAVEAYLYPT